MENILIPTDFSTNAWNAVEYAVNFFKKSSCNFYILHVCSASGIENGIQDDLKETCEKRMQELLSKINQELPKFPKHRFFSIVDNGYIVNSVRTQVDKNHIDFIVMGTKGTSDLKKIPIGSNASSIITKVQCTTVIVPENAKYSDLKEIAFPTDFLSRYSSKTLESITSIVEKHKASARVLHIKNENTTLNEDQQRNKELLDDYLGANTHSFHFLANNQVENQVQDFVENKRINLITMFAKNLSYFEKILFHPKMPELKYYTDIPFLVLH
ncbi:universal stress protein [Seonamhaeicola sp. ML3]|uniref:universal stress protein n=1 Tax=Seonamhaeicola sp. ML3 TaxID=2937786 RepID=UPI00200C50EE|nr:universal stress protein [Seonamhaeicola sp. ML3]